MPLIAGVNVDRVGDSLPDTNIVKGLKQTAHADI
jgi:hypothetical protein